MKKAVLMMALVAFTFSTVNAQEKPKAEAKKECSTAEKKSCAAGEKKAGCCASKKADKKD
ncbi:MAG: hypothetical protein FGM16_03020 [Flavobacterium sp.]|nr:hypothetical protein [Flavobacterium sp.]